MPSSQSTAAPALKQVRAQFLSYLREEAFAGGHLRMPHRNPENFFGVIRPELEYAGWLASEWADPEGSMHADQSLVDAAVEAMDSAVEQFRRDGRVTPLGDLNTPYFSLVPMTHTLLTIKPALTPAKHKRYVEKCVQLFDDTAEHIDRTHEYLNPRAMEAASAMRLHQLTGEQRFLDRCNECIDELLTRQYACGAQPYNTGGWIWGRRPSQVYQFLTVTMMLNVGQVLGREDVFQYCERVMDYERVANSRFAEPFITPFEGLHKSNTASGVSWQWPFAAAMGEKYQDMARSSFESWYATQLRKINDGFRSHMGDSSEPHTPGFTNPMLTSALLGVRDVPPAQPFVPTQGLHAMPDISTIFVHEPKVDLCATLLTGYSAFAQAECGSVRLYALTPELTDAPTSSNCGTDAVRVDWKKPTEQIACQENDNTLLLHGRVYTKWDVTTNKKDFTRLHARELEVKMSYAGGELLFEYRTTANKHVEPVPNRLVFLLRVRSDLEQPVLTIGKSRFVVPAAAVAKPFYVEAAVAPVRFEASDGSAIEIIAEETSAQHLVGERPPRNTVPRPGKEKFHTNAIKPANEDTLRLCFDGPNALDHGRLRIRFLPG